MGEVVRLDDLRAARARRKSRGQRDAHETRLSTLAVGDLAVLQTALAVPGSFKITSSTGLVWIGGAWS